MIAWNRESKNVTLIKLGGSIITNKEIPMEVRKDVLNRLVEEIARARAEQPEMLFMVGHGQGSFGHVPATKYQTIKGFINEESVLGMAIVQDSAAQLNRIVVHAFLEAGIPAVSLYASNTLITNNRASDSYFIDVFEEYIQHGLFPITGGDVIVDRGQGCTIWSTEEVLAFFAQQFRTRGWNVEQIVHVTEVDGVYDHQHQIVPVVTAENWPEIQKAIGGTRGFDVTGGMALKISESLELAKAGIPSKILSGLKAHNLYNALSNRDWVGTTIE
jgi:isopentenyl phosphate kinase